MNYILITKTLIIFSCISGLGLLLSFMVDDFDNNKPTKESYLKSDYYAETNLSYDEAMIVYDSSNDMAGLVSTIIPIIGMIMGCLYYKSNAKSQSFGDGMRQ